MGASAIHTQYSLSPLSGGIGITTIHDVSFFIGPEWFKPKDRAVLRASVPAAAKRASRVITVSETSKREIAQYIPGVHDKVRVTYPAGHTAIVPQKKTAARQKVKQNLGIEGPFVLTVGTIWPRKNTQLAVEAMRLLPTDIAHKLVLTGKSGWGNTNHKAQTTRHEPLTTGYVSFEDLSALYSAADLYLAPSRHEGFGIPIIEAFHCGCPVLCSSGGALPETAGNAAEIEPTWEAAHWAQTIRSMLEDSSKLDELRAKGLERAKRFTWEETARKTLEVYKEVAG
jgi:glycosyltransferase involved in cell wall biosynthesis